jgi:transcriptional regulator with PAS, ATPase and Fis domain
MATTNRRLEESIERKEFRQDLFFRLNVLPMVIPPLRERLEDVPFLAQQFMQRFNRKHGVRVKGISDEGSRALMGHSWPGNVRELQNVVERAVILSGDNGMLDREHFGLTSGPTPKGTTFAEIPATDPVSGQNASAASSDSLMLLSEIEKRAILSALEFTKGNRTHAAKHLGISIRTLRNKLHEYGVAGRDEANGAADSVEE